jgi:predicted ferric reductase
VVVSWFFQALFLMNATVLTWLWVHSGGISSVHNLADAVVSAGRLTGLWGGYLLLVQVLLLSRLPFLEWVAGFDRLAVWHKLNGKVSLYLILAHVGLITVGYAMLSHLSVTAEIPILLKHYYGMVAALIGTIMLVLVVVTSLVIVKRRLRYEAWYLVHLMAYAGIILAWFHETRTGLDFISNPWAAAYWTAISLATLELVVLFRVLQPAIRTKLHQMRVAEVVREGPGVVSVRITGNHLNWLNARAGQFFLWRFLTPGRWAEAHPFSLSAAPDGKSLRITVKELGDFTSKMASIKPGTRVIAEGPFGTFTDKARSKEKVALIAGGIGITPIRALLEEMTGDVVLVYRAISENDVVFRQELEQLARSRRITIHYVLGDHRVPANRRLMSPEHLRELVPDMESREVYLCGPPVMTRILVKNVREVGVVEEHIHIDEFAF